MEHRIEIEKIISGGRGLAHLASGQVIMVDGVLPGEQVLVRETRKRSGYLEGEVTGILARAESRVVPRCPWYGDCGGCNLQHAAYPAQLHMKEAIVAETFQRSGLRHLTEGMDRMLPSPQEYGYRFRLRMRLDRDGRPGFLARRSRTLVPVTSCPVATPALSRAILELADQNLSPLQVASHCVELFQSPLDNRITAVFSLNAGKAPDPFKRLQRSAAIDHLLLRLGNETIAMDRHEPPVHGQRFAVGGRIGTSYTLHWSPGCFSQVNTSQNARLVSLVGRAAGSVQGKRVLDLYCGSGNLSLPLALAGAEVLGVESDPVAVHWGRVNARSLEVDRCRFQTAEVGRAVRRLLARDRRFHTVILDPPRQGMGRPVQYLADLAEKRILYVSCDPATLARDLAWLLDRNTFRVHAIRPLDMFPQTHHIETLVVLERN